LCCCFCFCHCHCHLQCREYQQLQSPFNFPL
jgi:hypothetical protein